MRLHRLIGPQQEPVSVAAAKKQLEIADSDTAHDEQLIDAIVAAREQLEDDTPYVCVSQTFELIADQFPDECEIEFPVRPITSLTSITYAGETLSTEIADLDRRKRRIVLKHDQEWPDHEFQTDSIVITFVAGYTSQSTVPRLIQRALLLQVAKWFEDRDMMMPQTHENFDVAYERV
ncbi:MAG: hypothetical protein AAF745_15025, partial [Planctomycetota bacterium]